MTFVLGGAENYPGKDPTISHRRLHNERGVRVEHFHAVAGHLKATLEELGAPEVRAQSESAHSLLQGWPRLPPFSVLDAVI